MAVTLIKNFYINFGLFLFACIALVLSVLAFAKPCKNDEFKDNDESIFFDKKETCEEFTRNNISANWYCRGWSGECNTTNDCPTHPFEPGKKKYPCLCPGSNNTNCKQKVCKIDSSLPYCVQTSNGKWEVECN